jgi:O-antigen/teichoic acid export membrane protein
VRDLLRMSGYLSSIGVADVVINALDRVILVAFRSTATVGLYEGAARPHALVRQLQSTLSLTVVPVASGYIAAGDDERLHDLLLRGTRYVMAIVVPVTVVLMTLSDRILDVWLGPTFVVAAPAMTILLSYWLTSSATGVAGGMLVAAGRVQELNRYAWLVAGTNLALSLALTPLFGLEGVVIGTAVPYVLYLPYFARVALRTFSFPLSRLARDALLPAYTTGALVAAVAGATRLLAPLDTLIGVMLAIALALALGWAAYAVVWMRPYERRMVRSVLR